MRHRFARLVAVAALAAAPGCFLNEIDKSMEAYEGKTKPAADAKTAAAPGAPAAPTAAGKPAPATPSGPSWWATARTLGSEPMDATIAGCQLAGRVEYMRRDDCLARGGHPQ